MKKIFTQSLLAFLFVFTLVNVNAQFTADYIWGGPNSTGAEYDNSTFNGGLNDWTIEGLTTGCPQAIWEWVDDGMADLGTYYNTDFAIESPTVSNGAMAFDSDYFESSSICGGPHTSTLTSPSIDCSNEDKVAVLFFEYYRVWATEPFLGSIPTYIEVSKDGGATWSQDDRYRIPLNDDVSQNNSTGTDAFTYVDISASAAGEADVRFRFVWAGRYYFWIIDDVSLISSPQEDFATVYDYFPANTLSKPAVTGIECDTFLFISEVRNVAQVEANNVHVDVTVVNELTADTLHEDTFILETFPANGRDTTVTFDPWFADNTPGEFRVYYDISSPEDSIPEFYSGDNVQSVPYYVNEDFTFTPSNGGRTSYPNGGYTGLFAGGVFYRTCDFGPYNMELVVDSLGFMCDISDPLTTLEGEGVTVFIKEVIDEDLRIPSDLSAGMENEGWRDMGNVEYEFENDDLNDELIWVGNLQTSGGDPAPVEDLKIEPNKEYVCIIESTTPGIALGFSFDYHYQFWWHGSVSEWQYDGFLKIDDSDTGTRFSGGGPAYVPMKMKFLVNTTLPKLPENSLQVVPNPVQDMLRLELSFEQPTDVSYAVGTMTGSLIKTGVWEGTQVENQEIDINELTNGNYLIRIQTKDGVATKMFTVAK